LALEVERKFLVADPLEWLARCQAEEIEQGYLAVEGDTSEVRLRRSSGSFRLTVKGGSGLERTEVEVELDADQFNALWPLTARRRISKVRHYVPTENGSIEVDVYRGALRGLVVAEVELADSERVRAFEPPDWFGEEVTGHPAYANKNLASRGLPDQGPSG
jgi:CYTH domain-containing protein